MRSMKEMKDIIENMDDDVESLANSYRNSIRYPNAGRAQKRADIRPAEDFPMPDDFQNPRSFHDANEDGRIEDRVAMRREARRILADNGIDPKIFDK